MKSTSSESVNKNAISQSLPMLVLGIIFISLYVSSIALSSQAADYKDGWFLNKKGRVYYYENGNKVTGQKKQIGDKYYYFDKKGRQHVGWLKYKGHYYYYNIGAKQKGYMVCNKTINGIRLNAKGQAVSNKKKARLLAESNEIVFSITNFKMSKKKKIKACFMYVRNKTRWYNLSGFRSDLKNWDQFYASYIIYKGYGDCYAGGCAFAYLATAAGAKKVYAESSGGHGWAEIRGRFYDPNWSWISKSVDKGYNVPKSLSGTGGRPSWSRHRYYVKRIDR